MKISKEVELKVSDITSHRNVRSTLRQSVEKYWVGKTRSNIGMQYLTYKDGLITARDGWERRDLVMFQHPQAFNIFVEPDESLTWNMFDGAEITVQEKGKVERFIRHELSKPEMQEYFATERRFFGEKPWMQVNGMTPEEAVAKLRELGW